MFGDDIIFKMGLDATAFARGLRTVKSMASDTGNAIKASFASAASAIAGGFGIIGLVGLAKQIHDYADEVKRTAEALDVTTDFVQGFGFAASQSGSSTQEATRALEKLTQKLGEALDGNEEARKSFEKAGISLRNENGTIRNTADVIFALAKRMNELPSAAEKIRVSMELLGKTGKFLVPTLQGGEDELRKLMDSASKITPQNIKTITDFGDAIAESLKKAKDVSANTAGPIIRGLRDLVQGIPKVFGAFRSTPNSIIQGLFEANAPKPGITDEDQASRLAKQQLADEKERAVVEAEINKLDEKHSDNLDKLVQKNKQLENAERSRSDQLLNSSRSIVKAEESRDEAIKSAKDARLDRSKFTLNELATSGVRFTGRLGEEQRIAWLIMRIEARAKFLKARGFDSSGLFSASDKLKEGLTNLTEAEKFPFANLDANIKSSKESLQILVDGAVNKGLLCRLPVGSP